MTGLLETSLDRAPLGVAVRIARIDWTAMSDDEGRRLREFGLMEGCEVTPRHRGSIFSRDPLALTVGRMKVIIRARQAAAIAVEAVADGTGAA
ncbi:ferrous iron transport protein A [Sphingopyxis sp. PET50]|uniref:FeoA family protein n=1 Tax=Sphingopyxis sp. PET50 TaxID=2976533 RepID=UPI0021B039A3|nr:ferrous iron transport protein A [Sphingopyxis sp. PET50]